VHQILGRKTHDGTTESDLSKFEQEIIQNQSPLINSPTVIYAEPSTNSQSAIAHVPALAPVPPAEKPISPLEEPQWYLMRNPQSGVTEGPFTVNDLRHISELPGFVATQSYSFRYGDTMMVPLLQVPGVSRREGRTQLPPIEMPLPPEKIQANAGSDDWYVQREDGQIFGPYSFAQLSGYLESGHITRNTYCWRQGMPSWLYAYQVPGLDRRQSGPPALPIPIPKVG